MNPSRIIDMASAYWSSCVLFAASDAGIFDFLAKNGPSASEAVAQGLDLDPRGAELLLNACVAVELLQKDGDRFANTPETGLFLVSGSPADLTRAIRYNRDVYAAWGKLGQLAQTGKPVEAPALHLGEDAERTRTFVLSMHGRAMAIGRAAVPMLDLAGVRQLFDAGGGPGTYSVLIAQANPEVTCQVMDLPGVTAVADELIKAQGMSSRVKTIPGDYHSSDFPQGNDVVLFFGVLHQESPESIQDLFARAYASLNPGGSVYVMDMMTDASHTQPPFSALFAVNMALTTESGWVFSDEELKGWLTGAGFKDFSVTPLPPPMPHWMARAKKA
ncbi:MAG: methyltransferase domain-containing protein [Proteobacteria bacterium]|nr:methyltransferase domain-containing protein [Pseudomonadota bacterium]